MKTSITELEDSNPTAVSSRRDFTKRSIQALLTISLLDHLCSTNLLSADAKLTAEKHANLKAGWAERAKDGWDSRPMSLARMSSEVKSFLFKATILIQRGRAGTPSTSM